MAGGLRGWLRRWRTARKARKEGREPRKELVDPASEPTRPRGGKGVEIRVPTPEVAGHNAPELAATSQGPLKTVLRKQTGEMDEMRMIRVETAVRRLQDAITKLDSSTERMRGELEDLKEGMSRMEKSMIELEDIREGYSGVEKTVRELSALYDLISGQINPFVEGGSLVPAATGSGGPAVAREEEFDPFADLEGEVGGKGASGTAIENDVWVLRWTEFLLERMDAENIPHLLEYYKNVGWIDEDLENKVLNFIAGSRAEEYEMLRNASDRVITENGEVFGPEGGWKLSIDDHVKSLQFIERIRGKTTDHAVEGVSQEAARLKGT